MDAEMFKKILSKFKEVKILCEDKIILQFDNNHKHKSFHAYEFYQENSVRIIDWPSYCPDLNPIKNIWER